MNPSINYNKASALELKAEIDKYKSRERTYKLLLEEKNEKIAELKEMKKYYESIYDNKDIKLSTPKDFLNNKVEELNKILQTILNKKNSLILSCEQTLFSLKKNQQGKDLQTPYLKYLFEQFSSLNEENKLLFEQIKNTAYINNFKNENDNEKSQINQLMMKIIENKDKIRGYEKDIEKGADTLSFLRRKTKFNK